MSLFKWKTGKAKDVSNVSPSKQASISLGRYTNANRISAQLEYWKKSKKAFESKYYLDSFENFFYYLRDELVGNVSVEKKERKWFLN